MRDLKIEQKCPNCHKNVVIRISEMTPGQEKQCPHCRLVFKFEGDNGRDVQKSLDDLGKTIKRINQKSKLKI